MGGLGDLERNHFRILLEFGDRVRGLSHPREVMAAAIETAGNYCGVSRSVYSEIDDAPEHLTACSSWTDGRLGSISGHAIAHFGPFLIAALTAGRTIWSEDVRTDERLVHGSAAAFAELGVRAFLSIPMIRDGRLVASMCLHDVAPHRWTADEIAFVQDIATRTWNSIERMRLDLELRESQSRLRTLSDAMPQLIWTAHVGGSWDSTSRQWRAYTGLTEAQSIGLGWLAAVHPDDRAIAMDAWHRVSIERGADTFDVDIRLQRHDGAWRWFQTLTVPLPTGADEAAGPAGRRWLGTCTDVDGLKRTEHRLRESEARFRTMADAMPQIVWTATPQGRHDYYNRRWYEYTGLSRDASMDDGWIAVMHPDDVAHSLAAWDASLRTGDAYEVQYRHRGGDGAYRWFMSRGLAVREAPAAGQADGRIERWIGTGTDVQELVEAREVLTRGRDELEALIGERTAALTQAVDALHAEARERSQAEEHLRQSQKMEAVGQLTGGIAHDFNNMLQGIGGNLDIMQSRLERGTVASPGFELGGYLKAAQASVVRAGTLTHRLLSFARRQVLDARPVDADELIEGMSDLIRRTVGPGIRVDLDMNDGEWPVLCDANQLENALLNLVINARDAMPDGGVLTITTREVLLQSEDLVGQDDAAPGDYVEIDVTDSGTGIPPELLAHVFEPFFTTKPTGQGTGLGLSQVYGFVRQSSSVVRLESEPGEGTTVRIYMPRWIKEAPAAMGRSMLRAMESPAGTGETVLVVEDDDTIRPLIVERLRELGYAVLEAVDAPSALRQLEFAGRLALLVTDVGLPDGPNGRQVAEIARHKRPELPVLFITGYAGGKLDDQLAPGMEVIVKPFRMSALTARIHDMIAGPSQPVA